MTVAYVAQTRDHVLMLDDEGICLHVHRRGVDRLATGERLTDVTEEASRCLGAQYVAAIDPGTLGFLVERPMVGLPMLFAKVGSSGKVAVIRTGPLRHFEVVTRSAEDRLAEPGSSARDTRDTQPMPSPDIRYLADYEDDEEPTLRDRSPGSSRRPVLPALVADPGARSTPPFPLTTRRSASRTG